MESPFKVSPCQKKSFSVVNLNSLFTKCKSLQSLNTQIPVKPFNPKPKQVFNQKPGFPKSKSSFFLFRKILSPPSFSKISNKESPASKYENFTFGGLEKTESALLANKKNKLPGSYLEQPITKNNQKKGVSGKTTFKGVSGFRYNKNVNLGLSKTLKKLIDLCEKTRTQNDYLIKDISTLAASLTTQ